MNDDILFRGIMGRTGGLQQPTAGPTMAAWKKRIPQDIDGKWPSTPKMPSMDELADIAMNSAGPMGVAGSIKNVAGNAAKKTIQGWHGSSSGQDLAAFSRKFFGKGQGDPKHGMGLYTSEGRNVAERYAQNGTPTGKKGLYRVEIDADPDDFLDLDAMLKEQNPTALERLKPLFEKPLDIAAMSRKKLMGILQRVDPNGIWNDAAIKWEGMRPPTLDEVRQAAVDMEIADYLSRPVDGWDDGMSILRRMEADHGKKKASQMLEQAGFAGTRYRDPQDALDAGRKNAARNYAVFNPDRVRILEALGLAGLLGGGAMSGSEQQR